MPQKITIILKYFCIFLLPSSWFWKCLNCWNKRPSWVQIMEVGEITTWQQKKQQKQELVTYLQKWHFSTWQIKFHHLKNIFKGNNLKHECWILSKHDGFPYLKICTFRHFGAFLPKVDLDHNWRVWIKSRTLRKSLNNAKLHTQGHFLNADKPRTGLSLFHS